MISLWQKMRERIFSPHVIVLFGVYLLGIASIIRANRSYLDDVGRSLYGYADWVAAARPLSELFAWLFYLGPTTVDASPLTQVLAAAILAVVSVLVLEVLRVRLSWPAILCTVPIGLSPYGLENLSYKFDSPCMALALLFAVLACCFMRSPRRSYLILSGLCIFASASLYQPALGAYLCIATYVGLTELASRRSVRCIVQRFLRLLLPFFVAAGFYALQVSFWFSRSEYMDYVSQHASMATPSILLLEMKENVFHYISLIVKDWSSNGLGMLMAVLGLLFCLHLLIRWAASLRKVGHTPQAYIRLALIVILLPCLFLTPFGVQYALVNPVWAPRTFQGFGMLVALMMLSLYGFARHRFARWAARCIQTLLLVQLLVFANVYGNLLDAQNQWELSRLSLLSRDLNHYITETGSSAFTFVGSVGLSPLAVVPARKYPLLERLVTVPLTRDWRWGYEQLNTFGVQIQRRAMPQGIEHLTLTPFIDSPSYKIQRAPDDTGIVTFLPPPVPRPAKSKLPAKPAQPPAR